MQNSKSVVPLFDFLLLTFLFEELLHPPPCALDAVIMFVLTLSKAPSSSSLWGEAGRGSLT